MSLWPQDNESDYLRGMLAYADKLAEQARSLDAALAATAVTVRRQEFELAAQDVVIERLEFTRDVSRASRITLREKVLEAYHEAQALSLNRQGNAVAATTGSPAIVAETQQQALAAGDASGRDLSYETTQPVADIVVTHADIAGMPDPLENARDIPDFTTFLQELGWNDSSRTPGDPSMWQLNLERELDAQAALMDRLRPQIEQQEAEVGLGAVVVKVGARGDLRDLTFTPELANRSLEQLNRDFRLAYAEAANQAADKVDELVTASGLSTADAEDPDLPDPFAATYRRIPRPKRRQ